MTLERYLSRRRYWEAGFWVVGLSLSFLANAGIAWLDLERRSVEFQSWEPFVWEASSSIVWGLLIPIILVFDSRFTIRPDNWRQSLSAHALFTTVCSLIHVASMYWMRVASYKLIGASDGYHWSDWWSTLGYEYLKDFRSYFIFLAVIYLYRFILRRLQGEAEFLPEVHEEIADLAVTDRFLVKKLGREFLVLVSRIDWIESAGNYVNLHVGTSVYPLRETMTGMSDRLAKHGFQRVHRSVIVNLERIAEIVTFDSGDGELRLTSDVRVPASRRYRKELRARLRHWQSSGAS